MMKVIPKYIKISKEAEEKINLVNESHQKTGELLREAFDYLVDVDKHSIKEAKAILRERSHYTPRWINEHLPDKAKNLRMRRTPKTKQKNITSELRKSVPQITSDIAEEEVIEVEPIIEEATVEPTIPAIVLHFNNAVNVYLEALTGHELGDDEDNYSKSHVESGKELRKEIVDSLDKNHCKDLMKELLLLQSLNDEMIKLMEKRLTK